MQFVTPICDHNQLVSWKYAKNYGTFCEHLDTIYRVFRNSVHARKFVPPPSNQ